MGLDSIVILGHTGRCTEDGLSLYAITLNVVGEEGRSLIGYSDLSGSSSSKRCPWQRVALNSRLCNGFEFRGQPGISGLNRQGTLFKHPNPVLVADDLSRTSAVVSVGVAAGETKNLEENSIQ